MKIPLLLMDPAQGPPIVLVVVLVLKIERGKKSVEDE
jgi:hypothetical protein